MSDSQKKQRPGATPIKNPLLSASVTGLTFDDFPNKPLLLPAAPPIAHSPITTPVVTPSGIVTRETKSLVTVGSTSLDTENLDEINLNATNEDNHSTETTNPNENPLLEQSNQSSTTDSILSQAASSFSALPTVASSVFSTFSKRINAISSRETTPIYDQYQQDSNANTLAPQIDIQPTYTQQQQQQQQTINQGNLSQTQTPFYPPPQSGNYFTGTTETSTQVDTLNNLPPPEPPKFYTPSDVPSVPLANAAPPANIGGQNNFRFSSKKKLYAPIPGLSDQSQKPAVTLDPSGISAPTTYDNTYGGYASNNLFQQTESTSGETKTEERSLGSGLFSKISNLAPTGVLQNITGLVQSAAGSLTQSIKTDSNQQFNSSQALPPPPVFDQQNNYFSIPPPPTNFFVPPSLSGQETHSQSTSNTFQNIQPPTYGSETSQPTDYSSPQQTIHVTDENLNQPAKLPPVSAFFQNNPNFPTGTSQPQIPFYNPSNLPPESDKNLSFQPTTLPSRPNRPPSRPPSHPNSAYAASNTSEQPTALFFNPTDPSLGTVPQVNFFDPTKYLPSSSQPSGITQTPETTPNLPPTTDHTIPPPSGGHTSYRLQKGTKLYKSPLTPQETAPIHVTPNQIPTVNQAYHTQPSFTASNSVALFAPPVGEHKSNESIQSATSFDPPKFIEPAQSVPLFTPPVEEPKSNQPTQGASLFATPIEKLKSNEAIPQSIPLFVPASVDDFKPKESISSVSMFAPPVGDLKTKEPNQSVPLLTPFVSNDSSQSVPLFASPIEQNKSDEVKTNQLEQNIPREDTNIQSKEKDSAIKAPEQQDINSLYTDNKNPQPIIKPIEQVVDKHSSEIQKEINTQEQTRANDSLEQALQKISLSAESNSEVKAPTLPPISTQSHPTTNPYRRGSTTELTKTVVPQPTLANFFTPEPSCGSADLNFFATLPAPEPNLANCNSGINFFSESTQDRETKKEIPEPTEKSHAEPINFFTSLHTEIKPVVDCNRELTPIQSHTFLQPPITAFFPTLPNSCGLVPAVLENRDDNKKHFNESCLEGKVPPPIGFESFARLERTAPVLFDNTSTQLENTTVQKETTTQPKQPEVVSRFKNLFNQTNQTEIVKDPSTFFDSFAAQTSQHQQQIEITPASAAANEEQRIQYFFNNPPPKDANAVGDLNYDLVHSGLGIRNLQQRSLTPISNLVEPPSSACSEFSELSNSTTGQKSISTNQSITECSEKSTEKEDNKDLDVNTISKQVPSAVDSSTKHYEELPEEILKELRMANLISGESTAASTASGSYKPAIKHWFYKRTIGDKQIWMPFSHYDSALLETSLLMEDDDKPNIVAVEGGRYDVNISERKKLSVYWDSEPIEVRRCSWFYKAVDSKYVPYEEQTAELLEKEYKQATESGVWHKTIILGMGEQVVFHGPTVIVHFQQQQNVDAWGGASQTATRPRVVKRDLDDFNIEEGESQKVDHLLFMVHGIGSACDLKLRTVEEVVEDFRTIARQLVQSHYKNSTDLGLVGRVEVLPISWHSHLHSVEMGIDEKLRTITLESIPKLRNFTNDTLLDILFYTSPTFCQKIMNTVVTSMNEMYLKYRERHPEFNGGVSLAGHSLGSLILFDLLCHQNPIKESEEKNFENPDQFSTPTTCSSQMDSNQLVDKQISYTMGPAGTGQPFINYGQLIFQPKKFFALGSPIGMFVTIRGIDKLGLDFRLPTCPGFYNIFHPYDPVAYRIEALVNPDLSGIRPLLIPHHKGRKRMHLELKETMTRVSMDLKNRFLDKFKTTLDSVNIFGSSSTKSTKEAEELEKEVDKVIQMQLQLEQQNHNQDSHDNPATATDTQNGTSSNARQRTDSASTVISDDVVEIDFPLGKLNDSKRIDYVLQEAPLEFINEYIFTLSSHVCYWDSEDTILFVMKEIYSGLGISPDSQVPQQTMTIERPSSRNS